MQLIVTLYTYMCLCIYNIIVLFFGPRILSYLFGYFCLSKEYTFIALPCLRFVQELFKFPVLRRAELKFPNVLQHVNNQHRLHFWVAPIKLTCWYRFPHYFNQAPKDVFQKCHSRKVFFLIFFSWINSVYSF